MPETITLPDSRPALRLRYCTDMLNNCYLLLQDEPDPLDREMFQGIAKYLQAYQQRLILEN